MKQFIETLSGSSILVQAVFFAVIIFICWAIENTAALFTNDNKWKHTIINAGFILTNIPVQFVFGLTFAWVIHWATIHHFGLMYHLPFIKNYFAFFLITFILLDFGEYIYHVIMHKVKRLWMFHAVHHSDPFVDVSTTVREHPVENFIRTCFALLWVFLSGSVFWVLFLRQLIQTASTIFAHVNYQLPEKIDKYAGLIFITPNLHHVHHHYKQPYTDCNYGDVLSIWDRLFGTFCRLPANKVVFGLDTFMEEKETSRYLSLISIPFGKYRKSETPERKRPPYLKK
jgi:sterol desaturase/sphingolipid hydroxylase (fatty acid hydroxylase superfamily)